MSREPSAHAPQGVVARVDFGGCVVLLDDDRVLEATVRGRVMGPRKALGNAVVVGDRVALEHAGDAVAISGVEPRRNTFSRRAPGKKPVEQVVAANLDQVVCVASFADPEFSPGLVDRVLCQAEHLGLPARLAVNKHDLLAEDAAAGQAILDAYALAGYPVHPVSAHTGEGLEALRRALLGRRSLFVGHSGVGKSRLLHALEPRYDLLSGQVNPKTGKGRHTTTAAWLLRPEAGFELIDTPGVRAFGLWAIGPRDLDQSYAEFRRFLGACRFADCAHDREPGCALREAVARGEISDRRLASYHKLRDELAQEQELERLRGAGW